MTVRIPIEGHVKWRIRTGKCVRGGVGRSLVPSFVVAFLYSPGLELGDTPNIVRRLLVELPPVERESLEVLSLKDACLVINRDQLRIMVEVSPEHFPAEVPISLGEQLMLMPDVVDDL